MSEAERAARRRPEPTIPRWLGPGAIWLVLMAILLGVTRLFRGRRRSVAGPVRASARQPRRPIPRQPVATTPIWIRRISIGYDWRVREALQSSLDALAGALRLDTDRQRSEAVREVLSLLREHNEGARYGLGDVYALDSESAPAKLDSLATDLRARFSAETRGARASAEREVHAKPEEGPGMLVVTLLFGSYTELPDVELYDRPSTFVALHAVVGDEIPGIDVIWSPAEPDDRMSSYELEQVYPELRRMNDAGDVGSVACGHCGAPRPAELPECPACGSPAKA